MKSVHLPQARGGKALEVHLGPQATKPQVTPLTHKEVVQQEPSDWGAAILHRAGPDKEVGEEGGTAWSTGEYAQA